MTTEPILENPAENVSNVAKSIVVVNTGDGKGKSSSAFGVMIRGVARDWNFRNPNATWSWSPSSLSVPC